MDSFLKLRIGDELKDRLRDLAWKRRTTMSGLARSLIAEEMERTEARSEDKQNPNTEANA